MSRGDTPTDRVTFGTGFSIAICWIIAAVAAANIWPASVPYVATLSLATGGLMLIAPGHSISLGGRIASVFPMISGLMIFAVLDASDLTDEIEAIRPMLTSDPDTYFSELEKLDEDQWRSQMLIHRPAQLAEIDAEKAAEIARKRAKEAAKIRANAEAERQKRHKGFHCLSSWDGSHSDFRRFIKENVRDPSSFEHIETLITPADSSGNHFLRMKFRSKNGFGGMMLGTAQASVNNQTCAATFLSVTEK